MMKDAKYKYKLAIRDAANHFENRFDDGLLDNQKIKIKMYLLAPSSTTKIYIHDITEI